MDEPTASASEGATTDPCPRCGRALGDAWLICGSCGEPIAAPAELPTGARLADGRYQVLGVIGRGGFGITYEMGDRRLQRRVAVKELFPESAVRHGSLVLTPPQARPGFVEARERFLREARVLARFTHAGIVRVYEVFEEHGTAYLVMELLDGRTLIDVLRARNHPFTEEEVRDVAGRVAAALRPVHAAGVLHRDVNPSNVMLTRHGRIVVIDFGLARDFAEDHTMGMTRVVTPGYAPLEQYRGQARFGPSTDVYGLAATCYRLATGRVPVAALERDGGAALPAPRHLNPDISKQLSDALLDGLELEPGHRPQDLDSLLARMGVRGLPKSQRSLLVDTVDPAGLTAPDVDGTPWEDDDVAADASAAGDPSGVAGPPTGPTVAEGRSGADRGLRPPVRPDPDATVGMGAGAPAPRSVAGPDDRTLAGGWPTVPVPPRPRTPTGAGRMTTSAVAPGSDLRLPLAVGPPGPGRGKLTIPLAVLAVASASAAPVLVTAIVVLVGLPLLATYGDSVAHGLRAQHGVAGGWAERRLSPEALAPVRFGRNVALSIVRSSPLIGIGAVLLGAWYGLGQTDLPDRLLDGLLRLLGAMVMGLIVATNREGSARFRTGFALDEAAARLVPGGRTTERLVIGWLVVGLLVAGSLWLTADPFPLP